jgi:hypothetical protein
MDDPHDSLMAGQIRADIALDALAARLKSSHVDAEIRESAHFEGGRYIRIEDEETYCSVERTAAGEFIVRGDAGSVEQLRAAALRLSAALTDLGLTHRLEVYDSQDQLAHHLNHRWDEKYKA